MMMLIMGGQSNQWWRCLIWLTSIDIKTKFNQQSSWVAASFCLRQKIDMVGNDRYLTNKHELILLITIDIWSLFDQQSWRGCCIILPQKILILMLMMISLRSIDITSLFDQQSSWVVALFCSPKRLSLLLQSAIATSPPHNPTELLQPSFLCLSLIIIWSCNAFFNHISRYMTRWTELYQTWRIFPVRMCKLKNMIFTGGRGGGGSLHSRLWFPDHAVAFAHSGDVEVGESLMA